MLNRQRRFERIAAALALAAGLAGCGGEPAADPTSPPSAQPATEARPATKAPAPAAAEPAGPAPAAVDACALWEPEDVAAIIGSAAKPGKPQTPIMMPAGSSGATCRYLGREFDYLMVTVYRYAEAADAAAHYENLGTLSGSQPAAGIGDAAQIDAPEGQPLVLLTAHAGAYYVEFTLSSEAPGRQAALTAGAAKLVGRLP